MGYNLSTEERTVLFLDFTAIQSINKAFNVDTKYSTNKKNGSLLLIRLVLHQHKHKMILFE